MTKRRLTTLGKAAIFGTLGVACVGLSALTPVFSHVVVAGLSAFSALTLPKTNATPNAIIVLGGGLTRQDGAITLNHFSRSRAVAAASLLQTLQQNDENPPIITSGVESPWLADYLKAKQATSVIISENASMNTCENAVFSAKLLAHHELPTTAYLVTDRYHMARARRQFAQAGITTTPYPAPLDKPLKWTNISNNLVHSRRAVYEVAALLRDIIKPQDNCRSFDEIGIQEISTPRRAPKLFS
ncbi:hypothetical protein B0181_11355 [Moraxella caviae]|uniref:DUF218 domain n=1 Tax=Moraxella caviae TaxID=34060 RepID=A0A1S9ZUE5_9GAMM|nr:YdcF family protein [Moraxella caviae]OOR87013.1 hypothetical protein B0181_11355 [Moraxella caviae]STZ10022.1 DUF218 domain [Moraxella caviae]VEW13213.1 DUF218 domain [Moraxella caviae]